jgi:hypothetical protein
MRAAVAGVGYQSGAGGHVLRKVGCTGVEVGRGRFALRARASASLASRSARSTDCGADDEDDDNIDRHRQPSPRSSMSEQRQGAVASRESVRQEDAQARWARHT